MAATDDNNNKPKVLFLVIFFVKFFNFVCEILKFFTYFKDYYKVLEIEYDATDEDIRLNYRRLALVGNLSFFFLKIIQVLLAMYS